MHQLSIAQKRAKRFAQVLVEGNGPGDVQSQPDLGQQNRCVAPRTQPRPMTIHAQHHAAEPNPCERASDPAAQGCEETLQGHC